MTRPEQEPYPELYITYLMYSFHVYILGIETALILAWFGSMVTLFIQNWHCNQLTKLKFNILRASIKGKKIIGIINRNISHDIVT